jgi:excisionase family DNA binding protein
MESTPVLFTPVLTATEAAAELKVHRGTIAQWVKSGRMQVARRLPGPHGGPALFTIDEVERVRRLPWTCSTCGDEFDSGKKSARHEYLHHNRAAVAS